MKKKIKIILIVLVLLLSVGCTKQIKDGKELVKYEETGQTLTANILCKPNDEKLLKAYEEHDKELQVSLNELPTCKSFTPNKLEYQSLWESIFVKPLAFIILKLGYLVKDMGISVMIIGLLIRIILMPVQIKSLKQSENMKLIQPEMERIEKKYKDKTDNDSLMAKSQETMMLYKKYDINPVSGCVLAFVQLPVFFAFLEAINRTPAIFEGQFLGNFINTGMYLGMTPSTGIAHHNYIYILLIVLIILSTYISFKNSMSGQSQSPEMQQQMKMMFVVMILTISFASLSLPTAIALYWIITNGFAVLQNLIIKNIIGKKN